MMKINIRKVVNLLFLIGVIPQIVITSIIANRCAIRFAEVGWMHIVLLVFYCTSILIWWCFCRLLLSVILILENKISIQELELAKNYEKNLSK